MRHASILVIALFFSSGCSRKAAPSQAVAPDSKPDLALEVRLSASHPNSAGVSVPNDSEVQDVMATLARYKARKTADGRHIVKFADGSELDVIVGSKDNPELWAVELRALTPQSTKLLYELAVAGNFILEWDDLPIAISEAGKRRVTERGHAFDSACVVARSPEELEPLLRPRFEAWKAVTGMIWNK